MMERIVTLKMNKSSQVTLPVAVKKFLGLSEVGTMTARMRDDGVLEIARQKGIDEVREAAFAEMTPAERRRVEKRMEVVREAHPDLQERIEAEKDWAGSAWGRREFEREVQKYGKF